MDFFRVISAVQIDNCQYQKVYDIEAQNSERAKNIAIIKLKSEYSIFANEVKNAFATIIFKREKNDILL